MKKKALRLLALALLVAVLFSGCAKEEEFSKKVVAKLGPDDLTVAEFRLYLVSTVKDTMKKYSLGFDDLKNFVIPDTGKTAYDTAVDEAVDKALHRFIIKQRFDYMMLNVVAEDKNTLQSYTKNYTNYLGGTESFEDALIASGLTRELYNDIQLTTYKEKLLGIWLFELESSKVISDDEIKDRVNKDYCVVEYVFVYGVDKDTGEPLPKELEDAAYQKAMDAYNEAVSGEDFLKVVEKYNEDETASAAAKGMAFLKGNNEKAFEDAAFSLEIGDISKPVKTTYGYFVIHRREIGSYIYEGVREVTKVMRDEKYSELMKKWREEVDVKIFDDVLSAVDVSAYF